MNIKLISLILFTASLSASSDSSSLTTQATTQRTPIPVRFGIFQTLLEQDMGVNNVKKILPIIPYATKYAASSFFSGALNTVMNAISLAEPAPAAPSIEGHMIEQWHLLDDIASPYDNEKPAYAILGHDNLPVPPLQRDNLLGKLSSEKAMELINAWLEKNPKGLGFLHKRAIRAQCDLVFNHYNSSNKYNPKMLATLKLPAWGPRRARQSAIHHHFERRLAVRRRTIKGSFSSAF